MINRGYQGLVRLVSPDGTQTDEMTVSGEGRNARNSWNGDYYRRERARADKRLRRLLSQGWKVLNPGQEVSVP